MIPATEGSYKLLVQKINIAGTRFITGLVVVITIENFQDEL